MIDKMGDLHSIANYSGCCSSSSSSLGWNQYHHNLEVFNTNMSHSCSNTPPYLSSFDNSDYSTGYLQDALFEFSSKRRRLLLFSDHQTNYSTSCPIQNCSIYREDDLSYLINEQTNNTDTTVSGNYMIMNNNNREMETFEEKARPAFEVNCTTVHSSSSSSLNSKLQTAGSISDQTLDSLGDGDEKIMKRKKMIMTRVVFPFGVVKPGGIDDGDMTLNDINERILMPPTRPVKHPVGEFACRPVGRLGLSGKPVVALTTIQTQGKGTITIIRTKNN